jgi:hypothetical protein
VQYLVHQLLQSCATNGSKRVSSYWRQVVSRPTTFFPPPPPRSVELQAFLIATKTDALLLDLTARLAVEHAQEKAEVWLGEKVPSRLRSLLVEALKKRVR